MVVLVAALLSFVAEKLRPIQERNVEIEKKQDILRSVGKAELVAEAGDKVLYIEKEYGIGMLGDRMEYLLLQAIEDGKC